MCTDISQAVIFAGGLGNRLRPFTDNNPKPMFPIQGKPFLQYLIEQIKNWNIRDIIILLGYLPEKVMDYFGEGSEYGVKITYVVTPVEYDTQYRLIAAKDYLNDEFLMMYCDNLCPVDFEQLVSDYYKNHALIQFSAYLNEDGYTKSNIHMSYDGKVLVYDKQRKNDNLQGVDIGYAIVSKEVLNYVSDSNDNFEAVVYPILVNEGRLYATVTEHRYYSIGSYSRIELTERYLSGQKYIFLDRDGTTNVRPPKAEYICKPEAFVWIDGAKEAIKKLNDAGYFVIMISNQAGIGRGIMTDEDFRMVQNKMQEDLAEIHAHVDAVYYCPHSWDVDCKCRKPKPGMLYQAQKDYSINLTECIMIGDDVRDMITANNAKMRGVLVNDDYRLIDAVNDLLEGVVREYEVIK